MTDPTPAPTPSQQFEQAVRTFTEAWQQALAGVQPTLRAMAERMIATSVYGLAYDGNEAAAGGVLDQVAPEQLRKIEAAAYDLGRLVADRVPDERARLDTVAALDVLRASTTFGYAYRGESAKLRRRIAEVTDPTELLRLYTAARELLDALPAMGGIMAEAHAFVPHDSGAPEHGTCTRLGCGRRYDAQVHQ